MRQMEVSGQHHVPVALFPQKNPLLPLSIELETE
jgi:hypothetical protein